jgi:DNA-binding MarR family transcriptional regulator
MPTNHEQKVIDLVPRVFFACRRIDARAPTTGRGISPQQAHILDQLDTDVPTSLQALASRMGVTAPTMSVAIGRLVREGYVRRGRDSIDGRRLDITISPSGVRMRKVTSSLDPRRVARLLRRLSRADLDQALRGLSLLAGAAREDRPAANSAAAPPARRRRGASTRASTKRGRKPVRKAGRRKTAGARRKRRR